MYYSLILVVVALGAFGLGRLSVSPLIQSKTIQPATIVLDDSAIEIESKTSVVASKNGSKYHLPWCAGASQIKPENSIEFSSEADAQAAGYERAANCNW